MMVKESHADVATKADGKNGSMSTLEDQILSGITDGLKGSFSFILLFQIIQMRM